MSTRSICRFWALAVAIAAMVLVTQRAAAHCDTLDGPVVVDAKLALQKSELTPALKWIRKSDEPELRQAFARSLEVRTKGDQARELADLYFFETLVRLHRAGEGAPYTGLKPAGTPLEPQVAQADQALQQGKVDDLVRAATEAVAAGIRQRFNRALETRQHAQHTVEAGRQYVAAYVQFVHYVEAIFAAAGGANHAHAAPTTAPAADHADHH